MQQDILNFVGGELRSPLNGRFIDNRSPASGKLIGTMPDSDEKDVETAVAAAQGALLSWKCWPAEERANLLLKIAEKIELNRESFALAESLDQGKPISLARTLDIPRAIDNFRFFAREILQLREECSYARGGNGVDFISRVERHSAGVCALITPWNLPLYLLTWKLAPALGLGNTVVCKPSEFTSLTAFMLAKIIHECGAPPGVCNFVFGTGAEAGRPLVAHPTVSAISFTGGTATGADIAQQAAKSFKKVSLELGGKNANLVFADCDFDHAVRTSVRAAFLNQGEVCLSGSRIFVEKSIYQKFLEAFIVEAQGYEPADPLLESTRMGALVSKQHLEKVASAVKAAVQQGATLSYGGSRPSMPSSLADGYYFSPTVITNAHPDSAIQQEEVFGPVVTISSFQSEEEALKLANSVRYGLSASVFTTNIERADRLARQLETGIVWINTWLARDLKTPFGGIGASGLGREGGRWSIDFYSETKTVVTKRS